MVLKEFMLCSALDWPIEVEVELLARLCSFQKSFKLPMFLRLKYMPRISDFIAVLGELAV